MRRVRRQLLRAFGQQSVLQLGTFPINAAGRHLASQRLPPTGSVVASPACFADFKRLHFPPPAGAQKPSVNDYARRRRWVRRRRRTGSRPAPLASLAAALGTGHKQQQQQEQVVTSRQVLGRAAPGEALPLPLGWSRSGRQLQLRPVLPVRAAAPADQEAERDDAAQAMQQQQQQLEAGRGRPAQAQGQPGGADGHGEEEGELHAVHDWSHGATDGRHALKLDGMDEGITRLVCCPSLRNTGKSGGGAACGRRGVSCCPPQPPAAPCCSPSAGWFTLALTWQLRLHGLPAVMQRWALRAASWK